MIVEAKLLYMLAFSALFLSLLTNKLFRLKKSANLRNTFVWKVHIRYRRDQFSRHQNGMLHLMFLRSFDSSQVVVLDHLQDQVGERVIRDRRVLVLVVALHRNLQQLLKSEFKKKTYKNIFCWVFVQSILIVLGFTQLANFQLNWNTAKVYYYSFVWIVMFITGINFNRN